jgi:hypothetical protein
MIAEIRQNVWDEWIGQFCETDSGLPCGMPWRAGSRSELIAAMSRVIPAHRLTFRDVYDPLDP